ncbi:hypothetical protein Pmani_032857 [Petrolisthes manimaculis]|uniref:Uncharacterized protein n=1 Tax=Petrolisthes manimaculis TaxID=1843537 RepID=A0AAE1TTC8_9EUCA|nr:hypothetical protein Pmani_032857 [Petrolisthes manimaculis]
MWFWHHCTVVVTRIWQHCDRRLQEYWIGSIKGVTIQNMIHSNSPVYPLGLEPRTNTLLPHHPMKYNTPLAKVAKATRSSEPPSDDKLRTSHQILTRRHSDNNYV